jgi:copper chaperone CopZ
MSEKNRGGEVVEREEVAPGLVMEVIHTHEPDGRYLIYYNFRTAEQSATFSVPAIVCDTCAASIRNAVAPLPGVGGVEVDLGAKTVCVRYDAGRTDAGKIRERIAGAGFEVAG